MSKEYICFSKGGKEEKNYKGEVIGISEDRALYFSINVGRGRVYRQTYPIPDFKNMKLFTYKKKGNAEKLCKEINEAYGDDFCVKELEESEDKQ